MGAVVEMYGEEVHDAATALDVCEIQALIILLDRQTVADPDKEKLGAWLVSIQRGRGFRVLEAWLDQGVDEYEFHFAVRGVEWPLNERGVEKTVDGSTEEWKWLLSWVLAQSVDGEGRN
ncbi:hypothetical protein PG997_010898 [Apiospora hydei]|uniref:Uncharacterized protein n=1 Tax=Apiospora hydei TaxID=1337664 RepID=A0ABR1VHM2_9PEZI